MIDKVKERIRLKKAKDELDHELRIVKDQITAIDEELAELFVDNGVSSMAADGYNVIISTVETVQCDQSPLLVQYLKENGFSDAFNKPINTNSLRALIKRYPEMKEDAAAHITVGEIYRFKVVKK